MPTRKTVGRLDSVAGVRRELARLYVEARRAELDVSDASKLANVLAVLSRILESSVIEERLSALEAAAAEERA